MTPNNSALAFAYLRLSREEAQRGESTSISNQRMIISNYCRDNGFVLVGAFADDGYTGSNFDRPQFREMMQQLEQGKACMVVTKDLSRLGRDMRESSYYAEQYFPEHGIRYIAIGDNFDTAHENVMAPFQFAMNEVYLRDGSRKVKDVFKTKRQNGMYCACPPFGYKKDANDRNLLVPDENTAPTVVRIFERAAKGDSTRKIAMELNEDGLIPPLKYRVEYRDNFSEAGAARASDLWNYTTVKRIIKNRVYLGHTILGKTKKVSIKSKKQVAVPKDDWSVTENTHEPLITRKLFDSAQKNIGRGARLHQSSGEIRKSIFSGLVFCEKCGHSLCSAGTVYKGEREKYWYLSCNNKRRDIANPCSGTRIKYSDLTELVKNDINSLILLGDAEIKEITDKAIESVIGEESLKQKKLRREKAETRLSVISRAITKLYTDNASGLISDEQLKITLSELQKESQSLEKTIRECEGTDAAEKIADNYDYFFNLVKQYTKIETLTRDILVSFIDRIEIGEKILPDGVKQASHRNQKYKQKVRIYYRFIDELFADDAVRNFGEQEFF